MQRRVLQARLNLQNPRGTEFRLEFPRVEETRIQRAGNGPSRYFDANVREKGSLLKKTGTERTLSPTGNAD